ncbi:ATP-binding protein [Vanrija albida]|uniref:ATP-binding protein n=1 Tax=Vanrija albida TaxID=181172 RepID=A0ABR3Q2F7_9TREE
MAHTRLGSRLIPQLRHVRFSSTSPTRSPRDLYNHLSQYVIGQEGAKKILSVAVFNHYRRIAPLITGRGEPEPARSSERDDAQKNDAVDWDQPTFEADLETSNPVRDSTRVTGAEDGSDPTLTHEALSREEKWARGDGYFSSRRPSLLGKLGRRGESDAPATRTKGSKSSPERESTSRKKKDDEEKREARRIENEARARRQAELEEAINPKTLEDDIVVEKSNVLVVGPTGTGKTLMAKTLARALDVPFVSCDATTYTQAGYVGEDVESCILRLLQAADYDVSRAEVGIVHIDEVDKLARRGGNEFGTWGGGRDVGGEGVQQALLRILEGTTVTLSAKAQPISSGQNQAGSPPSSPTPSGISSTPPGSKPDASTWEWDPNNPMGRTFGNAPGKKGVREGLPGYPGSGGGANKGDTFVVDTSNILFILSGAFVGLDAIIAKRLGKGSIGFGAPLPAPTVRDTMKASTTDLKDYGLIPEFLGRLPVLSVLHPLANADLIRILTEPRNALIKQYKALFKAYGSELHFTHRALEAIAQEGLDRGGGARGLRGVLEEMLVDAMFEVPGSGVRHCLVTAATVGRRQPAQYFSRGQRHLLDDAMEAESDKKPSRVPRADEYVEEEKLRAFG